MNKNDLFLKDLNAGNIICEYTYRDKGQRLSITRTSFQGFDVEHLETLAELVRDGWTEILSFSDLKTFEEENNL